MKQYVRELDHRFKDFSHTWPTARDAVQAELLVHAGAFSESYRRIASLQAWRTYILEPHLPPPSVAFFLESQNDALISHALAQMGSWRVALKSIRSCIENVIYCLFYMDHSVELTWWSRGNHRLSFTEVKSYLLKHPQVADLPEEMHAMNQMEIEYGLLSRAVHASARSFRMTDDSQTTVLWKSDVAEFGKWQTREKRALACVNQILLCLFREHLQGAALPEVRKAVSLAVSAKTRLLSQKHLGVRLPAPAGG